MALGNLKVSLELIADQYLAGVKQAQREGDVLKKSFDPLSKSLKDVGGAMTSVGAGLTASVTAPLLGIGALAVKTGIDFESSFAGIKKTVDGVVDSGGNITAFGQTLQKEFREMAKTIPISVNELNRIGEAAGQLGIKKEDLTKFTRTMADLGVTTNLTSEEAANATARFQNIFGAAGKDVDRFASTLVALGNAGASTEKDIIEMGLRIAAAGNQVGLSQAQVLSFASSLSGVGINAEAGGSAISRVFLKMNDAVKGGGDALAGFARVAGISAAEFKDAFEKDASAATIKFVEGLARIKSEGGNAGAAIEDLLGKNIIIKDTLLRASGAVNQFTADLNTGTKGWQENTAASKEAEQRYATTASQLAILKNQLVDVGITLFDAIGPVLRDTVIPLMKTTASGIGSLASTFSELPGPVKTAVIAVGGIAAIIGPAFVGVGLLATNIGIAIPLFTKLAGVAAASSGATGLGALTIAVKGVGAAFVYLQSTSVLGGLHAGLAAARLAFISVSASITTMSGASVLGALTTSLGVAKAAFIAFATSTGGTLLALGLLAVAAYKLVTAYTDLRDAQVGAQEAQNRFANATQVAANQLKDKFGLEIQQGTKSTEEWNKQVVDALATAEWFARTQDGLGKATKATGVTLKDVTVDYTAMGEASDKAGKAAVKAANEVARAQADAADTIQEAITANNKAIRDHLGDVESNSRKWVDVMSDAYSKDLDNRIKALDKIEDIIAKNRVDLQRVLDKEVDDNRRRIDQMSDDYSDGLKERMDAYDKAMEEEKRSRDKAVEDVKRSAGEIFDAMFIKGENVFSSLGNALKGGALSLGRSIFEDVTGALLGPIKKAFDDFFGGLLDGIGIKSLVSGLGQQLGGALGSLGGTLKGIIPGLGGKAAAALPSIPGIPGIPGIGGTSGGSAGIPGVGGFDPISAGLGLVNTAISAFAGRGREQRTEENTRETRDWLELGVEAWNPLFHKMEGWLALIEGHTRVLGEWLLPNIQLYGEATVNALRTIQELIQSSVRAAVTALVPATTAADLPVTQLVEEPIGQIAQAAVEQSEVASVMDRDAFGRMAAGIAPMEQVAEASSQTQIDDVMSREMFGRMKDGVTEGIADGMSREMFGRMAAAVSSIQPAATLAPTITINSPVNLAIDAKVATDTQTFRNEILPELEDALENNSRGLADIITRIINSNSPGIVTA